MTTAESMTPPVMVEVKKETAAAAMTKATLLEQVPVYCCDTKNKNQM